MGLGSGPYRSSLPVKPAVLRTAVEGIPGSLGEIALGANMSGWLGGSSWKAPFGMYREPTTPKIDGEVS